MHITLSFTFISSYLSRYYWEFKSARQQANGNASSHCNFSLLEVSLCSGASLDTAIWINKVKLAVLRAASALCYYSGHKKSARTEAEAGSSKGVTFLSKHQQIWLGEEQTLLCQEAGRWKAFWCDPRKLCQGEEAPHPPCPSLRICAWIWEISKLVTFFLFPRACSSFCYKLADFIQWQSH